MKAISGCTLIDGAGKEPMPDAVVTVEGERIAQVGPRGSIVIPPDAQQIDAYGKYLLPGMIELHSHAYHPMMLGGGPLIPLRTELPAYASLLAANNLRQALQAGITAVREVLALDYVDVTLRRAINDGVILGPRYFVAGRGIATTGHPSTNDPRFYQEANGTDDVRLAVREHVKQGTDLIKIMLSYATHSTGFSVEEMAAIVDEAHRCGLRVACHAWTSSETRAAAMAGVDTIEHGAAMDDETLDMVAQKGIFWVPTCTVLYVMWEKLKKGAAMPDLSSEQRAIWERALESYNATMPAMQRTFEGAMRRGVKIGTGTDMIHRDQAYAGLPEEVEWLTKLGYSPMQGIEAATRVSADALGKLAELGTVEKGKYADLIMVNKDPLKDITALKNVTWVMKGGRVVPFSPEYGRLVGKAPWLTL